MKQFYSIILLLLISGTLFSQTGTIKIVKPNDPKLVLPQKDTVRFVKPPRAMLVNIGGNSTLKGNNKFGYEAGVILFWAPSRLSRRYCFDFAFSYSHQNNYYSLSSYNKTTFLQETGYSKAQNASDYLKTPIGIRYRMALGIRFGLTFSGGLTPEYLLKNKNQYDRLSESDFNRFNLAGYASVQTQLFRNFSIGFRYSKDLFENLKDKNIYNQYGIVQGSQKSKTDLLSLSLIYGFYITKKKVIVK